jgi:hypothetical protein
MSGLGPATADFQDCRVLITVKTYPSPSKKYVETVCTAGITEDGRVVRLYPVPFRLLTGEHQFHKFPWVHGRIRKATADSRPESFNIDADSMRLQEVVSTRGSWSLRDELVAPFRASSVEDLVDQQAASGRSLGLVRPKEILRFYTRPTVDTWTDEQWAKLTRSDLFRDAPAQVLEKLPLEFHYEFLCDDPRCQSSHDFQVFDWEIGESYRKWRRQYGSEVGAALQQKYGNQLPANDLQFFLGTLAGHRTTWTIVGLYWPPRRPPGLEMDRFGVPRQRERLGHRRAVTQGRLFLETE